MAISTNTCNTVQTSDPVSNAADYSFILRQYSDTTDTASLADCAADTDGLGADREKVSTMAFDVAKATAFTSAALTTTTTSYAAGASAFVVVTGMEQGTNDYSATWIKPTETAASATCLNTGGGDRADTSANGTYPDPGRQRGCGAFERRAPVSAERKAIPQHRGRPMELPVELRHGDHRRVPRVRRAATRAGGSSEVHKKGATHS